MDVILNKAVVIVDHAVALAPAFDLGFTKAAEGSLYRDITMFEPIFRNVVGPISTASIVPLGIAFQLKKCFEKITNFKLCLPSFLDNSFGEGNNQLDVVSRSVMSIGS